MSDLEPEMVSHDPEKKGKFNGGHSNFCYSDLFKLFRPLTYYRPCKINVYPLFTTWAKCTHLGLIVISRQNTYMHGHVRVSQHDLLSHVVRKGT